MPKRKFDLLGIKKVEAKKIVTENKKTRRSIELTPEVEALITQCNAELKASTVLNGNCNQHLVKGANVGMLKALQELLEVIKDENADAAANTEEQNIEPNSENQTQLSV